MNVNKPFSNVLLFMAIILREEDYKVLAEAVKARKLPEHNGLIWLRKRVGKAPKTRYEDYAIKAAWSAASDIRGERYSTARASWADANRYYTKYKTIDIPNAKKEALSKLAKPKPRTAGAKRLDAFTKPKKKVAKKAPKKKVAKRPK